jgi:hypothetical protein
MTIILYILDGILNFEHFASSKCTYFSYYVELWVNSMFWVKEYVAKWCRFYVIFPRNLGTWEVQST